MEGKKEVLRFLPFSSVISPSFWESFSNLKLNKLQLNTDPVQISGIYSRRIVEGVSPLFHIQSDSAHTIKPQPGESVTSGSLINTNTIEEFKKRDKSELLNSVASTIWESILSGEAETNVAILSHFLIFVYGDLKKYQYYFWCAFPTFLHPRSVEIPSGLETLGERIRSPELLEKIQNSLRRTNFDLSFFTVVLEEEGVEVLPLSSYYTKLKHQTENYEVWLGFSDPSNSPNHPGWVLRNLLTLAAVRWSDMRTHTIFAFREKISSMSSSVKESLVFDVRIGDDVLPVDEIPSSLGWEKNERGKMGPRFSNMIKSMDPSRIAESAVELNLRLMKWRLDPVLDLDVIKNCRCLLIGAGTLGCNVARCLLGWGVQKISFVDGGKVSYSNPVRQSLYTFDDCKDDTMKAEKAAEALKNIYPRIDSQGICVSVPMPGHTVGPNQCGQVTKDVVTLEKLIEQHDAVFLLTDSRESRWLPSVIGAAKKKIVLTAALGFDSYLVMRHGSYPLSSEEAAEGLGCYFCNDVVAPGDSVSDRTLDQQCTVTRPGISFMAAGHIVEMLIDILQFPQRLKNSEEEGLKVPHSIRYYLGRMNQLITSSPAFKNCSACSSLVISEYLQHGIEFLIKVFNSPRYLEEISGLAELHYESQMAELLEISDEEESE